MGLFEWLKERQRNKRIDELSGILITPDGYKLRQYCRNIVNHDEYDMVPEFETIILQSMRGTNCSREVVAQMYLEIFNEISKRMYD